MRNKARNITERIRSGKSVIGFETGVNRREKRSEKRSRLVGGRGWWLASPEEIESGSTREPGQGRNPKEVGKERKHLTESVCFTGPPYSRKYRRGTVA